MTTIRVSTKNGTTGFDCSGCNKRIPLGAYAVAQTAMGHQLTHKCEQCGKVHAVSGRQGQYKVVAKP
jgi:transcription elongation factor Elf1